MNYFIEGLQGSGKTTLTSALVRRFPGLTPVREGDYSPVELAWCALMTEPEYRAALEKYPALRPQLEALTFPEGERRIVCYTKVKTDNRDFYRDMERFEIYNGRLSREAFRRTVLDRYAAWRGDGAVFECSLFQNTVEDMILFRRASDEEILDFYREVRQALSGKPYHILYLETEDIPASLGAVRRERVDEAGNEVWFSMLLGFFNDCPYAKALGVSGEEALFAHLAHRQDLELRICRALFADRFTVLPSKAWTEEDLVRLPG